MWMGDVAVQQESSVLVVEAAVCVWEMHFSFAFRTSRYAREVFVGSRLSSSAGGAHRERSTRVIVDTGVTSCY